MRKTHLCLLGLVAAGCVRIEHLPYSGTQEWPTGSAFIRLVEDMKVFEGLPDRPYEVLGLIDIYSSKPFYRDRDVCRRILEIARDYEADALLSLSDRTVSSGFFKVGSQEADASLVDSGRSSQPEMIVTRVSQYTATSAKKSLRSTVLMIQWR